MSEQYFNRTVKEVCKKSGLDHNVEVIEKRVGGNQIHNKPFYELVSAHTCRRSFCTNLFKKGISPQVIMIYSGHTQLNSFYKYIKVKPSDMIEDFLTQVKNGLNEIWSIIILPFLFSTSYFGAVIFLYSILIKFGDIQLYF